MPKTVGTVYVLANSHAPDLIKVGKSVRVETRLAEINSGAGVIGRWREIGHIIVSDMDLLESLMHKALAESRDRDSVGTEIFRATPELAASTVRALLSNHEGIKIYEDNLDVASAAVVLPSPVSEALKEAKGSSIIERFVKENAARLVYEDGDSVFLHPAMAKALELEPKRMPNLVARLSITTNTLTVDIAGFKDWCATVDRRFSLSQFQSTLEREGYEFRGGRNVKATLTKRIEGLPKMQRRVYECLSSKHLPQLWRMALQRDCLVSASDFDKRTHPKGETRVVKRTTAQDGLFSGFTFVE